MTNSFYICDVSMACVDCPLTNPDIPGDDCDHIKEETISEEIVKEHTK